MKKNTSSLVLFFLLLCLSSLEALSTNIHLRIMNLQEASAPRVVEDYILFSYKGTANIDYVGARFAHEEYKELHVYQVNQHGVFFLLLPIPEGLEAVQYRIVVDGIWMSDPFNPLGQQDFRGLRSSLFHIDNPLLKRPHNPEILIPGRAKWQLFLDPGRRVFIAGDFNLWDPYLHPLKEVSPGKYEILLNLPRGKHYYTFLVDGVLMIDPYNPRVSYDWDFARSYFFLE